MDSYRELADRLKGLHRPLSPLYLGRVTAVDGLTCSVEVDGLDIPDVRLRATTSPSSTELLITPAVGAHVLVGSLSGDLSGDLVLLAVDSASEVVFHGGAQGGLVLVEALTERLNALEEELADLKEALTTWTPKPQDGGLSLKVALTSWLGRQVERTTSDQIANPNIKQ